MDILTITLLFSLDTEPQIRPGPSDYRELDFQNDKQVKFVDGALIIKNIQKSHEGFYLCEASNGIGRGI